MVCAEIAPDAKNGRGPPGFSAEIKIVYVHDFGLQIPKQQPETVKTSGPRSAHSILACYCSICLLEQKKNSLNSAI